MPTPTSTEEGLKHRVRELDALIRSHSSEVRIKCQHQLIEHLIDELIAKGKHV